MASDPALLAALSTGLSKASSLGYTSASAAHDVYEAYILSEFLRAADAEGWTWELRDKSGAITKHAVFRMGPGRLPTGDFTHARLTKAGKADLEAHIGVKVRGNSTVAHEFDLLVLKASDADVCRILNSDPQFSTVVAHAEAKYYGSDLPLPLGRGVVGLAAECGLGYKSVLITNRNAPTIEALLSHYNVAFRFLIKPGNSVALYHLHKLFRGFLMSAP